MTDFPMIGKRLGAQAILLLIIVAPITVNLLAWTDWKPFGPVRGQLVALNGNLPPMNVTLIGLNGTELSLDEIDVGNLPSFESWGGFKNSLGNIRGLGNYTGVPLVTLCDLVGGITANISLKVTAMDNYTVVFSYAQVVNGEFITYNNQTGQQETHNQSLTPILAYYFNHENVTDGPLRTAIVGPEGLATDSSLWIKYVNKLEILNTGVHDVVVTDVTSPKSVVGQSLSCNISVTVANVGDYTESLNVLLYANSTYVATRSNLVLTNSTFMTITCVWDTTSVVYGNYTIWAYISPVPGEVDIHNNNRTDGSMMVAMVGDLTGSTPFVPDGKCDMRDIGLVARHFGETVPPANPNCDLTGPTAGVPDGKIDMRDVGLMARHFGEHYP